MILRNNFILMIMLVLISGCVSSGSRFPVISENEVCLFMKGTADAPQCGFSMAVSNVLKHLNINFKSVNVLEDENLRQGIKDYSDWPTIPQLYINGEFLGGCDICIEMSGNGELAQKLNGL